VRRPTSSLPVYILSARTSPSWHSRSYLFAGTSILSLCGSSSGWVREVYPESQAIRTSSRTLVGCLVSHIRVQLEAILEENKVELVGRCLQTPNSKCRNFLSPFPQDVLTVRFAPGRIQLPQEVVLVDRYRWHRWVAFCARKSEQAGRKLMGLHWFCY
jgi:hypothetical protein